MRYAVIVAALIGVGVLARFDAKDGRPDPVSDERPAYDGYGPRLESVRSERARYREDASSLEDGPTPDGRHRLRPSTSALAVRSLAGQSTSSSSTTS
jgi:hypothetical protein